MKAAKQFWTWFDENKEKYATLEKQESEVVFKELLNNLHDYYPNLFFEIGKHSKDGMEMIISADGQIEHFHKVRELVYNAPPLEGWTIIAFKPPQGFEFIFQAGEMDIDPGDLYFLPLKNEEDSTKVGVRVGYPDYNPENRTKYLWATQLILEIGIGERAAAYDINYLDVTQLPVDPDNTSFLPLFDINDYICYIKNRSDN